MKLSLVSARHECVLIVGANLNLKVVMLNAQLKLKRLTLDPAILFAHGVMLLKKNALTSFIESNMIEMIISQGSSH